MSNWIHFEKDWFNLNDFIHIWIEEHKAEFGDDTIGYYLVGEWRHNGEEVIISQDWESIDDLKRFLHDKLGVFKGWTRE